MGERRAGRFRLGRRRGNDAAEAPCVPCGQQKGLRAFSLNESTIDDHFVATLNPDVTHAITGGDVVLFDPSRATSTLLNSSAALVWASIDGIATVAAIVDDLTVETGADRTTIDADVRATIARFIQAGIAEPPVEWSLESSDTPPAPVVTETDDDATEPDRERRRSTLIDHVLARRVWTFSDERRCAGASVAIRTDSDALAAMLGPALAVLPAADRTVTTVSVIDRGPERARRFRVLRGTTTHAFASTAEDAFDTVFSLLNDIAINETPGRIVLHAGAVQRGDSIVVVAAPSGRGKSTVTAALVQRGFDYLTDEVVAVDPETDDVLPYPKPLDLDRSSAVLLGIDAPRDDHLKGKVAVARLGAVASGRGRVRLLVLLDDPDGSAPASPSPAQDLIELLGNTFASTFETAEGPADPLDALSTLAQRISVVHLGRASLDDTCQAIDAHLRSIDLAPTS